MNSLTIDWVGIKSDRRFRFWGFGGPDKVSRDDPEISESGIIGFIT